MILNSTRDQPTEILYQPSSHKKKTRALFENWQMINGTNHSIFANLLGTENNESTTDTTSQSLLDEKEFQNIPVTKGEPDCIPLSANINFKGKKRML